MKVKGWLFLVLSIVSISFLMFFAPSARSETPSTNATGNVIVVDQQKSGLTAALVNGKVFFRAVSFGTKTDNRELVVKDDAKKSSSAFDRPKYISTKEYFETYFKGRQILKAEIHDRYLYIYYK